MAVKALVAKWKPQTLIANGTIAVNNFTTTTKTEEGRRLQDKHLPFSSALIALINFAATTSKTLSTLEVAAPQIPWPKDHFLDASFPSHVPFHMSSFQRMYRLTKVLGSGSYGKVYLAINTSLGTEVAIKIMRDDQGYL